jgi:hypothetical protein
LDQIKQAGVFDNLRVFNDVITGKERPHQTGYGEAIVRDVVLDGRVCDIYHTDRERTDSGHRIFIHIKGAKKLDT